MVEDWLNNIENQQRFLWKNLDTSFHNTSSK